MAKQTITITVDSDIIEEIRQLKINISGEINEYLKAILARYNEDLEGINIKLENIALEKAIKKLNHWQSEVKNIQTRITKWEDSQKTKKEEELKKEKQKIENTKKCINCGRILQEGNKFKEFTKGKVCYSCFLGMTKDDLDRWSK